MQKIKTIQEECFTRTESDINGNPRYYIPIYHFFGNDGMGIAVTPKQYREMGLAKYRGKKYGSGFVVQSYNLTHTVEFINKKLLEHEL